MLQQAQQAPNIDGTDTGDIESAQGVTSHVISLGTEYGKLTGDSNGISNSLGELDTSYMMKYYDHSLKFPQKAIKAGITRGTLKTRVVFNKSHEFLRFEIFEEQPVDYFRGVLYQLKFVKTNFGHLYHPLHKVQKKTPKDAKGEHYEMYKFVFDLNSNEPILFYMSVQSEY